MVFVNESVATSVGVGGDQVVEGSPNERQLWNQKIVLRPQRDIEQTIDCSFLIRELDRRQVALIVDTVEGFGQWPGTKSPRVKITPEIKRRWFRCDVSSSWGRHIEFYFPDVSFSGRTNERNSLIEALTRLNYEMEIVLGTNDFPQEVTSYYLFPPGYVTRKFVSGSAIYLETDTSGGFEIPAHEKVHSELYHRFGDCFIPAIAEGTTIHFTNKRFPLGWINMPDRQFRTKEVIAAICETVPLNSSLPLVYLDKRVRGKIVWDDAMLHAYHYPLGAQFCDYIATTFGGEKLWEIYRLICSKVGRLVNPLNHKAVVENGGIAENSSQAEILDAVLLNLGLNPEVVG